MTKLYFSPARIQYSADSEDLKTKFNGIIRPELLMTNLDTIGLANRRGLSRKVDDTLATLMWGVLTYYI